MKKLKMNKGITLIALIITIIVLLILAVVAISAVKGDGIISHAKNAKAQYSGEQANEQDVLSGYELMLAQETGNAWKQEKTKVIKGNTTLNVGDTITNFTAGGKAWQVLGAENGKLLLTTTEYVVTSKTMSESELVWDKATSSYKNAEDELNKICVDNINLDNLTDEIKSKVTEVRSMKVEDINRVTGYNPATTGDGKVFGEGELYQYGNKVTYSMNASGKVAYSSAIKSSDTSGYSQFWAPNTSVNVTSSYTVTSTDYYCIVRKDTGLAESSDAYKLLFGNDDEYYWLASSCVRAYEGYARFSLMAVVEGQVQGTYLWDTREGESNSNWGVRPVVSLTSDFQPVK